MSNKVTYRFVEEPNVDFDSRSIPHVTSGDIIICAPKEYWDEFDKGNYLIDLVDIDFDKESEDAALDDHYIFFDREALDDIIGIREISKGYFENDYGTGYFYSKDQKTFKVKNVSKYIDDETFETMICKEFKI